MSTKSYIFLILSLFSLQIFAQDSIGLPLIQNYNYLQYHAHFQNWDAAQTKDGLMLFANGSGLLTFDGANWNLYKLPDENFPRAIATSDKGQIFLGGDDFFGQMIVNKKGQLVYKSLDKLIDEKKSQNYTVAKIIVKKSILYVLTLKKLYIIKNNKTKIIKSDNNFYGVYVINNKIFLPQIHGFKIIDKNKNINKDTTDIIFNFFEKNDSIFYVTYSNNIFYLNKNNKSKLYSHINFDFSSYRWLNIYLFQKKYLLYPTINKGLLVINFKGKLISKLNKKFGLISNNIYSSFTDKRGNLWLCTSDGLSHVELNSPIRIIDSRYNLDVSSILTVNFFNKKIYTNTGYHFYEITINKSGIKTKEMPQANGQSWDGITIGNELYLAHNRGLIRIAKTDEVRNYGPNTNVWKIIPIPGNFDKYFLGTNRGIYLYKYDGDSLRFVKKLKRFNEKSREMLFDSLGNLWVATINKGIYKIKLSNKLGIEKIKIYNKKRGLEDLNSLFLFKWRNHLLISTYKTVYEYDYTSDSIHVFHPIADKYDFSGKKVLQLVGIDKKNRFWFEYYDENFNYEVFALKYIKGKFVETCPITRRLMNFSFMTSIVYNKDYNIAMTNKGLVFINMNRCKNISKTKFHALIRKVSFLPKDSTIFSGFSYTSAPEDIKNCQAKDQEQIIDFKNNDIRFEYAAPFFIVPKKTLYRFKLSNYDKQWSKWSYDTKKEYTNLPSGDYTFTVEAKNIYNQISEPAHFNFEIKPPWYKTPYAYLSYIILFILLIIVIVKYFTNSLQRKNEKLEKIVEERTSELVEKNVELEQQTEEILTQAEELQIVNQELEKLSTAVRETDNAIILADKDGNFIWINSAFTKIFGYSFEELVNEVSHNLISNRTDPYVKEKINKCLSEKVSVEYELRLKNKFKKEIWVHTTLTPILDEDDEIATLIAIDSDITELKNAEVQIREQRDQIKASITYAKTIQDSILPTSEYISKLFDNFIIFKAKDIVSGDFYWMSNVFKQKEDGKLTHVIDPDLNFKVGYTVFFIVVDCTGHGVPGAFMSLIGSHLLGEIINEEKFDEPDKILQKLDSKLSKVLKRSKTKNYDGMVLSICRMDKLKINEKEKVRVTFSGAKQHITYYKKETGNFTKIRGAARQIGFVVNESINFENHEFFLEKDDFLFIYTDGLKDLNNEKRHNFGYSRIINLLKHNINKNVDEIKDSIEKEIKQWLSDENQRDDITFIGLKIK